MTERLKQFCFIAAAVLAVLVGTASYSNDATTKAFKRFISAHAKEDYVGVVREYNLLPKSLREDKSVVWKYNNAKEQLDVAAGCSKRVNLVLPIAFVAICVSMIMLVYLLLTQEKSVAQKQLKTIKIPEAASSAQREFIRRMNRGYVPAGLSKGQASGMIEEFIERPTNSNATLQKIAIEVTEIMPESEIRKQRQQEERNFKKREVEEEKLYALRDKVRNGEYAERKAKTSRQQEFQEFQKLVVDILADNRIEPQEVRVLKAWLEIHKKDEADFKSMFLLIDRTLEDGIIDEQETQQLYEGILDCIITLRARKDAE